MQPEKQPTRQNNEQQRKIINTVFNEVRQRAYVLGARERDFIDSTINTNKYEGYLREFLGMQYMRALALIYNHRVAGFKETQVKFDPI